MKNPVVASGYNSLQQTPLGSGPTYVRALLDRNREKDILQYICNTNTFDEILKCGQQVQFNKPVSAGPWRSYELNQRLVSDQPTQDSFCISICNAAYKSIKIDELTIALACNNYPEFENGFLTDVSNNLSVLYHTDVLTTMQLHVSARNIGKSAGRYGNIDLGTVGNPLHLTPDTIVGFFSKLRQVLQDAGRWYAGEMFVIVPRAMGTLLLETIFNKQMCCNSSDSVLFNGLVAKDILGFYVIESDRLTPTVDPATKRLVYPIVGGWNEAAAFAGDIIKARIKEMDGAFGLTYDMLTIYGGGVIYPEALTKSYVTFSTDGIVTRP